MYSNVDTTILPGTSKQNQIGAPLLLVYVSRMFMSGVFHFQDTSVGSVGHQSAPRSMSAVTAARNMGRGGGGRGPYREQMKDSDVLTTPNHVLSAPANLIKASGVNHLPGKGLRLHTKVEGCVVAK